MSTHTFGKVPANLETVFSTTYPDAVRAITKIMAQNIPGFANWDYYENLKSGLHIDSPRKPSKKQITAVFAQVSAIRKHFPKLDWSDEITYEEFCETVERETDKDENWLFGEGDDYIKSHKQHNDRMIGEYLQKHWKKKKEETL